MFKRSSIQKNQIACIRHCPKTWVHYISDLINVLIEPLAKSLTEISFVAAADRNAKYGAARNQIET